MVHFGLGMPIYLMAIYGSVMILVVIICRFFLKNKLPKLVLPLLWALVLIRLLVPFSLSNPLSVPVPEWTIAEPVTTSVVVEENKAVAYASGNAEYVTNDLNLSAFNWMTVLWIVFGVGVVVTVVVLFLQKWQYSKKLKDSLLVEHNETINEILRKVGVGDVLVFTNDNIASPLVSGILNPRIYLPTRMDFQNIQLLQHILTHEAMHIKRKDNLIKAVMLLAICLHWYNPLVWLMSKCLSSDIESACDAAVLKHGGAEDRQNYAQSLLAMAITGNRQTLLYSAFSKTEVERRIRSVLQYKKTTALMLALSIIFVLGNTVVFAAAGQAPFNKDLSSFCGSANSRWAVEASLTRDIALGEKAQKRADDSILDILSEADTNDPDILKNLILSSLSQEFGVEKGAFKLVVYLSLDDQMLKSEYATHEITQGSDGFYLYQGKPVRSYSDEMLRTAQSREEGSVDIKVIRDRMGQITTIKAFREGDSKYDQWTKEIKRNQAYRTLNSGEIVTAVEQDVTITEGTLP